MAKFLDKKEQVYDLKLTPYGHSLLSTGEFKPVYYSFYDDNVLYDGAYASMHERQNEIQTRIKEQTPYTEGIVRFSDVENTVEENSSAEMPSSDMFRLDMTLGDGYIDGEPELAPAWKVVALQSQITSSVSFDELNNTTIPQLNINSHYRKKIIDAYYDFDPENIRRLHAESATFADGKSITLIPDEPLFYIEEQNTQLLTENFEVEIFEVQQGASRRATATIEILDYSNFDLDEAITLVATDGKAVKFVSGVANSTTAADGPFNTTTFLAETSNATTAANLTTVINLFSDWFTAVRGDTDSTETTITVTQTTAGKQGNTDITLLDPGGGSWTYIKFKGGLTQEILKRKYFSEESNQIQDGFLVKDTPSEPFRPTDEEENNIKNANYYFHTLIDNQIDSVTACRGARDFNKESYYVDLDFDCTNVSSNTGAKQYYDIYGSETEPEECQ